MRAARLADTLMNQCKPREEKAEHILLNKLRMPKDYHQQVTKVSYAHFDMLPSCLLSQLFLLY